MAARMTLRQLVGIDPPSGALAAQIAAARPAGENPGRSWLRIWRQRGAGRRPACYGPFDAGEEVLVIPAARSGGVAITHALHLRCAAALAPDEKEPAEAGSSQPVGSN